MSRAPQAPTSGRYPIRAASRLTGIALDTLRAWERRYGAVVPTRDARGRMYTDADVARLRLLQRAVESGHSIGRLAALDDRELERLSDTGSRQAPGPPDSRNRLLDSEALRVALRTFDSVAIDEELARLATVLRPLELLRDVLMPVLAQVGDDWHQHRARIAEERIISSTMRNILGSFLRLYARRDAPTRLLFATPSGERHEIGTLGAALLTAASGLGVAYVGADLPAQEIVDGVSASGVRVLVLGLTSRPPAKATERDVRTIVRTLPADVELWAGGRGAAAHATVVGERGLVLEDYDTFQAQLARLGGRIA